MGVSHAEVNMAVGDKVHKFENSTKPQGKEDIRISRLYSDFKEALKDQKLQPTVTEPLVIKLKKDYEANALTVPRKVPYARSLPNGQIDSLKLGNQVNILIFMS